MIPAEPCLDANLLVAFASGELPPHEQARVEQHVDRCPGCSELLREALEGIEASTDATFGDPTGTVAYMRTPEIPREDDVLPRGSVIGRYIVLSVIGKGGLGRVYAAYDPELDRRVALKLLRMSAQPALAQRLLREAQAMARLSHENVVPVHDVGTSDRGPFIAMHLVEGGDFDRWLEEGPRRWQDIRDILVEAGRGLCAAHRAGLVHRDFKASNVLLSTTGRVMVTDFGLARTVSVQASSDSLARPHQPVMQADLTMAGAVVGTLGYIAPETFTGRPCDGYADQFSFCVTAYRALFGVLPYPRVLHEFVTAVMAGQLAPPQHQHAPAWLRRAIEQGLAPNPTARHPSMDALLAEMSRDKRVRRRWWQGIATTLVAGALAAGATIWLVEPTPTAAEVDAVQGIVDQARAAASRSYYVYPPADDPDFPTAYRRVLELEAMEGSARAAASGAATDLRAEFAGTLVRLGDAYWDKPGGIPFAAEYYAAALVFDPSQSRALERMLLTPSQLAALRDRASAGDFTPAELSAADLLAALAEDDPTTRQERLAALEGRDQLPLLAQATLDTLAGPAPARPTERRKRAGRPTPSAPDPDEPEIVPEPPPAPEPEDRPATVVDKRAAAEAVKEGQRAIAANAMGRAERAFVRALQHDPHRAAAYAGLGEVYFESGSYAKAVTEAKKAVRRAPRVAKYRMLLGDAYLKVVDLRAAREQYLQAQELGHPSAAKRLATVDAKLQ